MKDIFEKGLLVLILAVIAVGAGVIFLAIAFAMIATLLGNLMIWPLLGAAMLGKPISFEMGLGIAAALAVIIFICASNFSTQTERVGAIIGPILSIGFFGSMVICILGLPLWLVLVQYNGGHLTPWAIIPCGLVTGAILWIWMSSRKPG